MTTPADDDGPTAARPAAITIRPDDLSGAAVRALLDEHLGDMRRVTRPETMHALDLDALRRPNIAFFTAWSASDELMGCGALRELAPEHGEIKSMRTAAKFLRCGVGRAMMERLIAEARRRDYRKVSLETGAAEAFAAARQLYQRCGFRPCEPFAEYAPSPDSVFLSLPLETE